MRMQSYRRSKQALVALFALSFWAVAGAVYGFEQTLVSGFLAKRQAIVEENQVDVSAMSSEIRATVNECERMEREGKYGLALDRLHKLQKFTPLAELPSYDVQRLASWLYFKTGDSYQAKKYQARTDAMRELLLYRIGEGRTPEMPIQALMTSDIIEWASMQQAGVVDVKSYPFKGHELLLVTYAGTLPGGSSGRAYFEIDRRVKAKKNAQENLFAPIPLDRMKAEHRALFEQARAKRERFIDDTRFPYLELIGLVKKSITKAAQLDMEGKPEQAILALKEIEVIRPIEEIPLSRLIGFYSFLNGKVGNISKQVELRGLLFGINQAIAHSGDGLLPESAVQVIAVDEEYAWLADKHLTRLSQRVLESPIGRFDVLTVKNAAGAEQDYYFNITRMYSKYLQGLK
jgi:hypothetical protein